MSLITQSNFGSCIVIYRPYNILKGLMSSKRLRDIGEVENGFHSFLAGGSARENFTKKKLEHELVFMNQNWSKWRQTCCYIVAMFCSFILAQNKLPN